MKRGFVGLDVIGADYGGLVSSIFQAGGAAIDVAKQSQQEDAAKADAAQKLAAVIAADRAATTADWRAAVSAQVAKNDPSKADIAKADQMAADKADQTQNEAGTALPDGQKSARVKAAAQAVDDANKAVQDALRSGNASQKTVANAQLAAAQRTLVKAKGGTPDTKTGSGQKPSGADGLLSRAIVGPVKVWHALATLGAAGVAAVLYKAAKK